MSGNESVKVLASVQIVRFVDIIFLFGFDIDKIKRVTSVGGTLRLHKPSVSFTGSRICCENLSST